MPYKEEAKKIARDLCYPEKVIRKIERAKSEAEIEAIMVSARHNMKGA